MLAAALLAAGGAAPVRAHVTLAPSQAPSGSYARVALQVPHGCNGSATTALTVSVPAGFLAAKPMPKPGWRLSVQRTPLDPPVSLHGRPLTETVSQVRWEGGPLPNDFFDEFVVYGKLADRAGPLAFAVTQTCEQGEVSWSGAAGSQTPAPVLEPTPAPSASPHAHH